MGNSLFVVLGNQLFPLTGAGPTRDMTVFMAEDAGLCRYVRHHKQKIVLILAAMRAYRNELEDRGIPVIYRTLSDEGSYEDKLLAACRQTDCGELVHYQVEGKAMERRLAHFAARHELGQRVLASPMFLCSRENFADFLGSGRKPHMAAFYKAQRERFKILIDADGRPQGGKWSLDAQNRKRLPSDVTPPAVAPAPTTAHVVEVQALVRALFPDHPGQVEAFWLPTTRKQARKWLDDFLEWRFRDFGPYEDALTVRSETLFHSVLSPLLNLGLLTPAEVIKSAISYAHGHDIPLNSLEGFVRQVLGWREFVRGIYQNYSQQQEAANFWGHQRSMTPHWYEGRTAIPPLDDAISTASKLGWAHHIPRLMVLGNLMTLCEIQPRRVHRWFMEMFVDSANWVMGPNVYGMGLFSDGGIFASKPYICGSNYLLKMSDYKRGPWCDIVDGLYWRFIEKHLDFFTANPRLAVMARALQRIKPERRARISDAAEAFLADHTIL